MTGADFFEKARGYASNAPDNYISGETALSPSCAGMKIYDAPIFAVGAADDELFEKFKSPEVIGGHFMRPAEWLPTAKTVVSFFLPYTRDIRLANAENDGEPADEWLHARFEGQNFLVGFSRWLVEILVNAGYNSLAPAIDPRYKTGSDEARFTSNWSERHVAYACGLGTFGLSKGLITRAGTAGRFGSIVTELDLPKTQREYSGVYEWCTMCGVCVGRCPVNAISAENGKDDALCNEFLDMIRKTRAPRYGCGKCQTGVTCESGVPEKMLSGG